MSETTLTLPLEALPVVTAHASDNTGAPTAPTTEPEPASAEFARLLAIELSPGDEQTPEPGQMVDTGQPDLEPLPPPPPDVAAALPGGKDLPPVSGTPVPLPPVPMPDPVAAPLPGPSPEAIQAPPPAPLPDAPYATPEEAPVPGPVSPAAPKQSAELAPPTLPPSAPELRQIVEQRPTPSPAKPGQPTAVDYRAPSAPETSVSTSTATSTATPEGEVTEEALLAKSAEGQPSQASAHRSTAESAPPVSTHSASQPTPNLAEKSGSLPPRLDLPEPMRTPQWNENLGSRINWMANNQVQTAELRLNPPQLGPLEVRVAVQQDETRIMFTANNAVVREAVEAALPRLRELMGANGLNLVQVDVSAQGQGDRGQPSARNEPVTDRGIGMSTAPAETETVTTWGATTTGDGLFDEYA